MLGSSMRYSFLIHIKITYYYYFFFCEVEWDGTWIQNIWLLKFHQQTSPEMMVMVLSQVLKSERATEKSARHYIMLISLRFGDRGTPSLAGHMPSHVMALLELLIRHFSRI